MSTAYHSTQDAPGRAASGLRSIGIPFASGELATVAKSMEKIRKAGGPGMVDWERMAIKTAADASANKTDDVKADCKACHDAYKEAFRKNVALRSKPFP